MTKYLLIAVAVLTLLLAGAGKLYIESQKKLALAEQEVEQKEAEVEQYRERVEELNRLSAVEARYRQLLEQQVGHRLEISEGADALMSDEDWLCASSVVPDVVIDGMRDHQVAPE